MKELGALREMLDEARRALGSIVAVAVSPAYGDPASKLAKIALMASDALKALEGAV